MANTDTFVPTFTQQVDQTVFIEPLGGPTNPLNSLGRFPDALYSKSIDSHFIKFMYSLLGPAGVGWIKKNYLDAKLKLYAQGFTSFDIEKYYGDPFRFGRILTEELPDDPEGLLTREQWDSIKARDESYRNRAITFFNAARAGGTPEGIELAAQSGLNHAAFVIENYRALFDAHSDEPLGLAHYGRTESTEEFIVVPRQSTSKSEQQILSFADVTAVSGNFQLKFNGQSTGLIPYDADSFDVEAALTELGNIGSEGVSVSGGPVPNPFIITFTGPLSNQDVQTLSVIGTLVDNLGDPISISVRVLMGGVEPIDETVILSDEHQHNAQTAIDFLKPLNSLPTTYSGQATRTRQNVRTIRASSSYVEAVRYVTGSDNVVWPEVDSLNWIEPGKEKESQRIQGDLQAHYVSYHSLAGVTAYTDAALKDPDYENSMSILSNYKSEHVGRYDPGATNNFPFLDDERRDNNIVYAAEKATPPCSIPMEVTAIDNKTLSPFIGGTVHAAAIDGDGSGHISLQGQNWWSSLERRAPAADILEIDLGVTRMANWISFDVTRKPLFISLDYDHLDSVPTNPGNTQDLDAPRKWTGISLWTTAGGGATIWNGVSYLAGITYSPVLPPWQTVKIFFRDLNQHNISTRFLRLRFDRPESNVDDPSAPFQDPVSRLPIPYSVDVRNLRVGRYTGAIPTWNSI